MLSLSLSLSSKSKTIKGSSVSAIPLLVDVYSGAVGAYSLRKISNSTTSVVRVRRSSDNAEQDFSAAKVYDGTLEAFVGAGNTGFVTTWYDQSGNSNDLTQPVASEQPTIIDAGVLVTENGNPVVSFPRNKNLSNTGAAGYSVASIFSVKNTIVGAVNSPFSDANLLSGQYAWVGTSGGFSLTDPSTNRFGSPDFYIDDTLYIPADQDEIGQTYNNAGFHIESNIGADLSSWQTFSVSFSLGVSDKNNFSEVIVYPFDQSSNRTEIETNLANYYGITLA